MYTCNNDDNYDEDKNFSENINYIEKIYHNGDDDDNDNDQKNMTFERVWQRSASEERACAQERLMASLHELDIHIYISVC
jgi:hypothetical protein